MIDALIYDLDGTLIDSARDLSDAMNHALKSMKYRPKSTELLSTYIGDGLETFLSRAFETDDQKIIKQAEPFFMDHYTTYMVNHTTLYDGVKETLTELNTAGLQQFIFSNKPIDFIKPILDRFGITEFFKELIGQYMFNNIKPHPEAIYFLIEKYKLNPASTLMVGDNYTDIEAGHSAGIQTAFCSFGMGKPSGTVEADFEIKRFNELIKLVK